jgi:hypothetical protein
MEESENWATEQYLDVWRISLAFISIAQHSTVRVFSREMFGERSRWCEL